MSSNFYASFTFILLQNLKQSTYIPISLHLYIIQFFILFIFYTFLTAIVSLTLILIRVIRCEYYNAPPGAPSTAKQTYNGQEHHPGCNANHTTVIFILGIITILFFFFTFCMLLEQTEAISTNMSKIARMKTRSGMVSHPNEYAPVATEFNEVFGGQHPGLAWHWLVPLKVQFPEWAIDNIMGYEWDVTFDAVPYQEVVDTTDGDSSTASRMSSLGGRVSESGATGGVGGGNSSSDRLGSDGLGQLGMDVETGHMNAMGGLDQEPLEQELLNEEEREVQMPSSSSKKDEGVKKRSTGGSFT